MSARLRNLNPYELHKHLVNIYCLNTKGSTSALKRDTTRDRTDLDVVRENHRFLWVEDEIADTWEKQLARKYYDKLFKEYCICDLSKYKENKVALRWRIEKEVVLGKGQFQCGAKTCKESIGLKSWEVNFAYVENKEKKNALVKVRLCADCSAKLNYKSKKREVKRIKKATKKAKKIKSTTEVSSIGDCEDEPALESPESMDHQSAIDTAAATNGDCSTSLWKKDAPEAEVKTREEEFVDYLEELLL